MLLILPEEGNENLIDKVNFETGISLFFNLFMYVCVVCVGMCIDKMGNLQIYVLKKGIILRKAFFF